MMKNRCQHRYFDLEKEKDIGYIERIVFVSGGYYFSIRSINICTHYLVFFSRTLTLSLSLPLIDRIFKVKTIEIIQ